MAENEKVLVDEGLKGHPCVIPPSYFTNDRLRREQKANRVIIENAHHDLKGFKILTTPWRWALWFQPIVFRTLAKVHNFLARLRQDRSLTFFEQLSEFE
jgi:hypothetical protein